MSKKKSDKLFNKGNPKQGNKGQGKSGGTVKRSKFIVG
jgi:hypothetical protein